MVPRIAALVLAATLAGAALFVSAPAPADYDACMTFCLDEHSFSYCHPVCDGSAGNAGTAGDTGDAGGTESVVPTSRYCGTFDERKKAIRVWVKETYGRVFMMSMPAADNENVFAVDFSVYENGEYTDRYNGILVFDDACQVAVMELERRLDE